MHRQQKINVLPCGWSQKGLEAFNKLAQEIAKDRNDHQEEFEKAFKESIEQQIENSAASKNEKRKAHCIDTYNELNEAALIMKDDEDSDNEWVTQNEYQV
jgi:hypothetical protein